MKTWFLSMVGLVLAQHAWAAPSPPPFQTEMQQAFAKLGKAAEQFSPRLSPPFPDAWPLSGPLVLRYHAYATRLGAGVSDGEHVAKPWAVGLLAGKSRFDVTSKKLVELGIQGVRPIDGEELAALRQDASLRGWWDELALHPDDAKVAAEKRVQMRSFYCVWKKLNGVIAQVIVPQHAAFFGWLGCE